MDGTVGFDPFKRDMQAFSGLHDMPVLLGVLGGVLGRQKVERGFSDHIANPAIGKSIGCFLVGNDEAPVAVEHRNAGH